MTALRQRRRRRTVFAAAAGVVGLLTSGGLGYVGAKALNNYTAAQQADQGLPVVTLPETPVGLLASVNDRGRLTTATLVVLRPGGLGGSFVDLPVSVDTAAPFDKVRIPLNEAFATNGPEALEGIVESVLAVDIDHTLVADQQSLTKLFGPLGPIEVVLPNDAKSNRVEVVFPAGEQVLDAQDAARLLSTKAPTIPEIERRANLDEFWRGFDAAVGDGVSVPGEPPAVVDFASLFTRAIAQSVEVRTVGLVPLTDDVNTTNADVMALDRVDSVLVFASLAPDSMMTPYPGPRFQLRTRLGSEDKLRELIGVVLFLEANVVSITYDAPEQVQTDMLVYDTRQREDFAESNAVLGRVEFPPPKVAVDGIDATMVLGSDFLDRAVGERPVPSATTIPATDVTDTTT